MPAPLPHLMSDCALTRAIECLAAMGRNTSHAVRNRLDILRTEARWRGLIR